ncbi:MAG: IS110 family transposase [Bacilli bacterium]
MLSLPGVKKIAAATILSEYEVISNLSNPNKMLTLAGLKTNIQSGTLDYKGKMIKHGSGHLRYVIMTIALSMLRYSPMFYDYYLFYFF